MKIETNQPKINSSQTEGLAAFDKNRVSRTQDNQPEKTQSKDIAHLSEEAQMLSKAFSSLEGTSEVREEKVEALRAQIKSGSYNINYDELAKRMSGVLGLLG
ncbi:MAG: flagellar biosynthesis anti-sigma factor FlgM [Anaerolineaceae bacterium]